MKTRVVDYGNGRILRLTDANGIKNVEIFADGAWTCATSNLMERFGVTNEMWNDVFSGGFDDTVYEESWSVSNGGRCYVVYTGGWRVKFIKGGVSDYARWQIPPEGVACGELVEIAQEVVAAIKSGVKSWDVVLEKGRCIGAGAGKDCGLDSKYGKGIDIAI